MESETELSESNLNAVKEMLLDEDKIVTYISVSKDLCVHVNISKMLLHQVVQNIRKDKTDFELKVSYLVSGLSNGNEARITVCPEPELEEFRKYKFKIIYFEHIYSISKGSNTNFLLINHFNDFSLCPGSIKNSDCMKHSSSDIDNFKSSSLIVSEASSSKPLTPNKKKVKAESIEKVIKSNNGSQQEDYNTSVINAETKVKKEEHSPKKENNSKQSNQKINGNKTQKGIAGFFNKTSVASKKNATEILKIIPEIKETIKVEKMEVDEKDNKLKREIKSDTKTEGVKCEQSIMTDVNNENVCSISNGMNKTLNQIKKSSKVDKKRKRVLHVSDSDSEVESDPEKEIRNIPSDSDDEIPPTPNNANNIKITSGLVNPKKKRKVIDKTYQDDEGYILTKKVEVYESCSEDESKTDILPETKSKEVKKELLPKNNIKQKNTKKKMSSPQKGKQATLTTFFKRK